MSRPTPDPSDAAPDPSLDEALWASWPAGPERSREPTFLDAAVRWVGMRLQRAAMGPTPHPEHDAHRAEAYRAYKEASNREIAFADLAERLKLTTFETELLLLCLVCEVNSSIGVLCGQVPHSPGAYPCLAVAREVFPESCDWAALAPEGHLRRYRLVEIHQPPGRPLLTCPLRVEERVFHYVRGLCDLDDRLTAWLSYYVPPAWAGPLPPSHLRIVQAILDAFLSVPKGATLPVIQLVGPDRFAKKLIARAASAHWDRDLYLGAAEALPGSVAEIDSVARIWERECRLLRLALFLDAEDLTPAGQAGSSEPGAPSGGTAGAAQAVVRLLARTHRVVFLSVRERWPLGGARDALTFDVGRPEPEEQEEAWAEALGGSHDAEKAAEELSGQFDLNTATIRHVARRFPCPPHAGSAEDWRRELWDACRGEARPHLEALAAHLDPKADWERLILPELPLKQLREIADQVRYRAVVHRRWGLSDRVSRGLGLSVLFCGESGTGKTLAAEVLARALRLDLYVIDLSAVVSKYIGETEKNLRRLFDAAEEGGCALLFDEADALFGKRSEVKESHDRYANIEIDYLLQRMEGFRGLAILTTNRKSSLDQAFQRRLRFVVDFPFPDAAHRAKIWRTLLPPTPEHHDIDDLLKAMFAALSGRRPAAPPRIVPTKDLDYDFLGRFPVSGGSAFNVSINAAFRAAAERSAVRMKHVLAAIRTELDKEQKPYREGEFTWPPVVPTPPTRPARRLHPPVVAATTGGGAP